MAIPPAAAVPAMPTKWPLPILLAKRDAPICVERVQQLIISIFHISFPLYNRIVALFNLFYYLGNFNIYK